MKNLTINKPEVTFVYQMDTGNREPMVSLSDYEALQTEGEKLVEAFNKWLEKSEWVQETSVAKELGMHRADVMKSRIEALQAENDKLRSELDAHKAARIAYASEFPPDGGGQLDVGSIHQNIRKLKEAKNVVCSGNQPEFSNYDTKPPSNE